MQTKSEKGTLNWRDAFKGLIVAVIGAVFTAGEQLLAEGAKWDADTRTNIARIAIAAFVAYVLKNWLSNSQGNFLKKELTIESVQFDITTENQTLVKINGVPVNQNLQTWLASHPNWQIYDPNSATYFPTLWNASFAHPSTMEFSVDGVLSSQIISGSHPAHRPK